MYTVHFSFNPFRLNGISHPYKLDQSIAIVRMYICPANNFCPAAYIQMHFRILLIIEANTMNPDQAAPPGAAWSGSILLQYELLKYNDIHNEWWERVKLS